MPSRSLRPLIAASVLCAACGDATRPAHDLAGTWTYVDSVHFEQTDAPGVYPSEVFNVRVGRVSLARAEPALGERARFEGEGQEEFSFGSRFLGSSDPFSRPGPVASDRSFVVVAVDDGVRGLVIGPDVTPWAAVGARRIEHTFASGGECASLLAPNGGASVCTERIVWRRVAP